MSAAPAGWYPQADGRQRYWDGEHWTEHFAPASPVGASPRAALGQYGAATAATPAVTAHAGQAPYQPSTAGDVRPWFQKKRFLIPGGLVAFVLVINGLTGGEDQPEVASAAEPSPTVPAAVVSAPPTPSASPTPAASPAAAAPKPAAPPAAKSSGEYGNQPASQRAVVAAVMQAQTASDGADNDLARGAALRARTTAICKAIPKRVATKWTGKVVSLDANGDGKGVLEIEIAPDVIVKTWNNSFSDVMDETLIEPTDPLFDKVLRLQEDQVVTFSGTFPDDDANCIRENSLTLRGSLNTPGFIMKFSDVS